MTDRIGPGAFIAVVGASGVGKDTLLDAARERCGASVLFPRRSITRAAGPGEDYTPLTTAEFALAEQRGQFAVSWSAHGLDYGIPSTIDVAIRGGRPVVANVSRGILDELAERYSRFVVVRITVPDAVRAQRLHARNREGGADIARRLERADPSLARPVDHEICNDKTIADACGQLMRVIEAHSHERTETT
ncbi:phosphonate metabolism protein/1,5-bisphosphokinase (PRPP-forming) PhnN [Agreia sp. COWG]|uniref:phosphonate metabolism protein/1,5-bisphosphokinase (PRPP-forming) PhnN n=1 Tax=Agreia sp. COWG TaxID=2773266 RepID=UPI001927E699|nr:phosphonate metabolism protein/1,5-bisphosphokinase (PRPP-forming) PhnN [Agreia sp. COWG]CAD6010933.1 Ribose 1,5-bisphosphate phosphokinase PhnN [Agreia sp. COWG]